VHLKLKRNTLRRNYSCSLSKAPEYSTKVDEHIRYHVNGYYIRQYMQSKNRWTDKTWTKVNMPALSRYKCQLQPKDQHWMIKLIHNQLPLGKKRAHVSQVSDVNLQMCPCCLRLSEDHHHFLHCGKNPNYKSSWSGLVTSLTNSDKTPLASFNVAFLDCIDQRRHNGPEPPSDGIPEHTYFKLFYLLSICSSGNLNSSFRSDHNRMGQCLNRSTGG
jgi:hypothetical protein